MSIYEKWQEMISNQSEESFPKFWEDYSNVEEAIYTHILESKNPIFKGNFGELSEKFAATHELFIGFLDGISSSISEKLDLDTFTEESDFKITIDFEKLYFNMLEANAEHLYSIPAWQNILMEEKIKKITKDQKRSKIIVKEEKIGRNDLCPCGSYKKYKKCCGK